MTHPNSNRLTFTCEVCGCEFSRPASHAKTYAVRRCSLECRRKPRPAIPHPTMPGVMLLPLTRGKFALIDAEDAEDVSRYQWAASSPDGHYWTALRVERIDGKRRTILLHRHIMRPPADKVVDHINGDGLDNRRSVNLRVCTQAENARNRGPQRNNTSGYKGVSWSSYMGVWVAQIECAGQKPYIGHFTTAEQAARAYDAAARDLFGAFAVLNFPDG